MSAKSHWHRYQAVAVQEIVKMKIGRYVDRRSLNWEGGIKGCSEFFIKYILDVTGDHVWILLDIRLACKLLRVDLAFDSVRKVVQLHNL